MIRRTALLLSAALATFACATSPTPEPTFTGGRDCPDFDDCAAACEAQDADACNTAGLLIFTRDDANARDPDAPDDEDLARDLLQRACDLDNPRGCWNLAGRGFSREANSPEDLTRIAELFQRACELGMDDACAQVANLLIAGVGVERDPDAAFALISELCERGHLASCVGLGSMYEYGTGVEQDLERAHQIFMEVCDAGDPDGCAALAPYYLGGHIVPHDVDRALQLYTQACDGGAESACYDLGFIHLEGQLGEVNIPLARVYLERSCLDGDLGKGCNTLGILYAEGLDSVEQDLDRARQAFQRSCDSLDPKGCFNLGLMFRDGHGVTADPERAQWHFQRACSVDYPPACEQLNAEE